MAGEELAVSLAGKRVGFCICASHHHLDHVAGWMQQLVDAGAEVQPIVSHSVVHVRTRFGDGDRWRRQFTAVTGVAPWTTMPEVEPIGPRRLFDVVVVAPCTGATLARMANAITDSPVLMATKSQLRNGRPVVLGITSNDILGLNAANLAKLLVTRNVYFVPFGQDNPEEKPNSCTAQWELLLPTVKHALAGRQLQPLIVTHGQP